MSERIQKLARHSGATDENGSHATTVYCFTEQELKGFAELIVRECLKLCVEVEEDLDGIYNGDEREAAKIGSRFCYEAIKGEFGVEE